MMDQREQSEAVFRALRGERKCFDCEAWAAVYMSSGDIPRCMYCETGRLNGTVA